MKLQFFLPFIAMGTSLAGCAPHFPDMSSVEVTKFVATTASNLSDGVIAVSYAGSPAKSFYDRPTVVIQQQEFQHGVTHPVCTISSAGYHGGAAGFGSAALSLCVGAGL
jgi:hypothetical protein